ncbi:hypothetical protein SAMN02745150_00755 [Brevinema andersonii]|uniref:Uncharacterized protein n=1 Tax=Brevinema andersonii TaxID=34097 RepID=A0A1I1DSZ1_BREAD|nr:hypothetical protein [Brevinema andersonii]SFB78021.1 hypothetical protein SAMN02745150_00755 [Brevinema andersonii]
MVKKRYMNKNNWLMMGLGILITFLGYYLISPITRDYETPKAFFAILVLNVGLLIVILGLSLNFSVGQSR